MTFEEFTQTCAWYAHRNKHRMRAGQVHFNALEALQSEIANKIRGTAYDPFYIDDNVALFLWEVARHWNDQAEVRPGWDDFLK